MTFNNLTLPFLVSIAAAGLFACSHRPTVQDFPDTASPSDEVSKFEAEMVSATQDQVNVFSPANFKNAESYLKDAKEDLNSQRDDSDRKDTLRAVARGRAYLMRSQEFATLARANMEEVALARQRAIVAGAPIHISNEFVRTDALLTDITSDIENNDLKTAVDSRNAIQLKYLNLELGAIKRSNLQPTRNLINQAKKEGAEEFAPRSLAIAEKSLMDADAFITANRHETAQISQRTDKSRKSADLLIRINRSSKAGKKVSSEDLALQIEGEQNKVAEKQGQLSLGRDTNAALAAQNSSLKGEQALSQRYEVARAEFADTEAEVYKKGNLLTIRLRGLKFPTAQAVIRGSNYPLLVKVQKVISEFGRSSVTVEGHTDSHGTKALNEKLSSERAESVRKYLSTHSNDRLAEYTAVGYGDRKPLATNRTAEGRAQNRRVDVLIQPEASEESEASRTN